MTVKFKNNKNQTIHEWIGVGFIPKIGESIIIEGGKYDITQICWIDRSTIYAIIIRLEKNKFKI